MAHQFLSVKIRKVGEYFKGATVRVTGEVKVQVNRLDIVDFGETESNVPTSRLFRIENHGNTTMNVNVTLDTPNQKSVGYSIIEAP